VAKLFAKHMKIEEQQAFLEKEVTRVVVGTPNRLEKLVELGVCQCADGLGPAKVCFGSS
jgi:superfamily II DNA/RNA helicase